MKWIEYLKVNPDCDLRIFCFHYAGGSASMFFPWCKSLPEYVELAAIQWPGRESRFGETLVTSMHAIIQDLFEEFKLLLDKPFIVFGHSIGAIASFELAMKLYNCSVRLPEHLIVSGCRAPHLPLRRKPISNLSDDKLISELMHFNGTPKEIFAHKESVELFLPIIRADFTVSETYNYLKEEPLPVKITAIHGQNDTIVCEADVEAWAKHTTDEFRKFTIRGDHFFIKSAQDDLINIINQIIANIKNRNHSSSS
jgi:surfactin synthase thioesterase subunit